MFGEQPSSLDATVYGFLCEFILSDIDNAFNERAFSFKNLVQYCERIRDKYYIS